jgi:hypothetical protein
MTQQRMSKLWWHPLVHGAVCLGVGAAIVLMDVLF